MIRKQINDYSNYKLFLEIVLDTNITDLWIKEDDFKFDIYELFKNIIKNKCDVRIILDSDAKPKQDKIANLLYEYGINITTVDLTGNCDIADIFLKEGSFDNLLKNEYPWERRTSILSRIDMIVTGSY